MTTPVFFHNKGELPVSAFTILGISVKGEDAIGRFGTGLKYTIAGILRLGGEISIETGGKTYYFSKKMETVRGKIFEVIQLENMTEGTSHPLGFTTELGKFWEPWMLVRELWSNMVDEDGVHGWVSSPEKLSRSETRIIVNCAEFSDAYAKRNAFLLSSKPTYNLTEFTMHEVPLGEAAGYFLKGIRIGNIGGATKYHINFKSNNLIQLSEDRLLVGEWSTLGDIGRILFDESSKTLLKEMMTAPEDSFFWKTFVWPSDARPEIFEIWQEVPGKVSKKWIDYITTHERQKNGFPPLELSTLWQESLAAAVARLKLLGYTREVKIIPVNLTGERMYGFAKDGKIYLDKSAFENGTPFLTQTLMEEYLHVAERYPDYSREMQDVLLRKIISLSEELYGRL